MIVVETVSIGLTDLETAVRHEEIAAMLSDMALGGLNPCVLAIETHAGGDSFIVEIDYDVDAD